MQKTVKVTIMCAAYNQEDYIEDAIESFLMQKTDFKYEIIIHDDASIDKTASIIKEYEKKYPEIIRGIYQEENQFSQGKSIIHDWIYPKARGEYFALCEGDDYWIDPFKLQKQVNGLEEHPEVDMCAHASIVVDSETKNVLRINNPYQEETIATVEDVIMGGGGFFSTNSLVYRRNLEDTLPKFRDFLKLDYTFQIQGSLSGGALYLPEVMSAYRWMAKGSWSSVHSSDISKRYIYREKENKMFDILNEDTNYRYESIIMTRKSLSNFNFFYNNHEYRKAFSKRYILAHKYIGKKTMLKLLLKIIVGRKK